MSNQWYRTNNPAMKEEYFTDSSTFATTVSEEMTLNGTIGKTGLLLIITMAMGLVGFNFPNIPIASACFFIALGAGIFAIFKREYAMPISLIYAPTKGYVLGVISLMYSAQFADTQYKGIVPLAIVATFAVFGTMLGLYATRIIKVTETFKTIVIGATLAAMLFYFGTFAISFFNPKIYDALPVFQSGVIGIGFSLFMIVLAAANFALDFDMIENGVNARAPKYMEWFGALAVLLTIVWLYIEMLRLLSKLARR